MQVDSLQESLPDEVMNRLPGWMRDKVEDIMAEAELENQKIHIMQWKLLEIKTLSTFVYRLKENLLYNKQINE